MIFGIDTASVAGNKRISWPQAKANGPINFAFLRATWGTATDKLFVREWEPLKAAGLVAGAYMFLRFRTVKHGAAPPPADQARALIAALDGRLVVGEDFPPALDVEFPGKGAVETRLTASQLLDGVREAWNVLSDEYGVPPIIYTSGRVWSEDLDDLPAPDLIESPLWLARYPFKEGLPAIRDPVKAAKVDPPVPAPWDDDDATWFIHQYQGDAVDLPGFPTGNVDMNRFHAVARGDQGGHVAWIQRRLAVARRTRVLDGPTETAIRKFQADRGLVVDGVVGPKTFARLCWI